MILTELSEMFSDFYRQTQHVNKSANANYLCVIATVPTVNEHTIIVVGQYLRHEPQLLDFGAQRWAVQVKRAFIYKASVGEDCTRRNRRRYGW